MGSEMCIRDRTVAIFFTRSKREFPYKLKVDGVEVPYSQETKYLGVTLDKQLHWKSHINGKIKAAKRRLMQFTAVAKKYWGPRPKLMKWAYTGIARTILAYAAFVWAHEIDHPDIRAKLLRLNRLAILTYAHAPRSAPTKGLEIITDTMPLPLFLQEHAVLTFARIHKQVDLDWEGMYLSLIHI